LTHEPMRASCQLKWPVIVVDVAQGPVEVALGGGRLDR
jgi:hypothetical protein